MHFASRIFQPIIVLVAAGSLASCWTSSEPLILSRESAQPLPSGTYDIHEMGDDYDTATLKKIPGGGYIFDDGEYSFAIMFLDVGNGWYAIQFTDDAKEAQFFVGQVDGSSIRVYEPICDDQIRELDDVEFKVRSYTEECEFLNQSALVATATLLLARIASGEKIHSFMVSRLDNE